MAAAAQTEEAWVTEEHGVGGEGGRGWGEGEARGEGPLDLHRTTVRVRRKLGHRCHSRGTSPVLPD